MSPALHSPANMHRTPPPPHTCIRHVPHHHADATGPHDSSPEIRHGRARARACGSWARNQRRGSLHPEGKRGAALQGGAHQRASTEPPSNRALLGTKPTPPHTPATRRYRLSVAAGKMPVLIAMPLQHMTMTTCGHTRRGVGGGGLRGGGVRVCKVCVCVCVCVSVCVQWSGDTPRTLCLLQP